MTPEKASRMTANLLIQAFKLVCPEDKAGEIDYLQGASFPVANSGRKYFVSGDAQVVISNAVEKIRSVLGTYPIAELPAKLTEVVVEVSDAGTSIKDAHQELQRQVLALVKRLTTLGTWVVLHAVRGVQAESTPFAIGRCTFLRMDEREFWRWGQRFSTGNYNPPENTPVYSSWQRDEGVLQGQTIAVVTVSAADRTHAESEGRRVIEESLNALRYGQLIIDWPREPIPEFGLSAMWSTQHVQNHSICLRVDGLDAGSNKSVAGAEGAVLRYCQMAPAWNLIQPLLLLEPSARTEMQNRIMTALSWVGQAALASTESVRVVALTTALETLLIREHESSGKRSKLIDRVPRFPQLVHARRHVNGTDIDNLYKVRSGCLHAGRTDVEQTDRKLACLAVAQCVHGLLDNPAIQSASTLDEVLTSLCPSGGVDVQELTYQSTQVPPGYYVGTIRLENGSKISVPLRYGGAACGVFQWSGSENEPPTLRLQLRDGFETTLNLTTGTIVHFDGE
jgi:hypothetical protein